MIGKNGRKKKGSRERRGRLMDRNRDSLKERSRK